MIDKITIQMPLFQVIQFLEQHDTIEERVAIVDKIRKPERSSIIKFLEYAYGEDVFTEIREKMVFSEWIKFEGNPQFSMSTFYDEIRRYIKFENSVVNLKKIKYVGNTICGGFEEIAEQDANILQAMFEGVFINDILSPQLAEDLGVVVSWERCGKLVKPV